LFNKIFINKIIMDKLISEEIQRMTLLSKYDNSKTLSEQSELDEYTYKGVPSVPAGETAKQLQALQPQKPVQPVKKQSTPAPLQLKDVNGVKAFQDWLDTNAKGWATGYKDGIINKGQNGGGYGKYGPRTIKAWNTYKDKYLQSSGPQSITSKQSQTLPTQTPQPQKVQAPTNQQTTVTSANPPVEGEEITLQPRK
jgi:hypothetical protein